MTKNTSSPVACIDIGSNSILLSIAKRSSDGWIDEILFEQQITQLGEGLSTAHILTKQAMERSLAAILQMVKKAKKNPAKEIFLVGTEALRKAENSQIFIDKIRKKTSLTINVLSPREEARLGYLAVHKSLSVNGYKLTVDIGGGSTELTFGKNGKILKLKSLPIGCVVLKEKFSDILLMKSWLANYLETELKSWILSPEYEFIGMGGTITSLGAIHLRLPVYGAKKVHGHCLDKKWIDKFIKRFPQIKKKEGSQFGCISPKRMEVLPAGSVILLVMLNYFKQNRICISDAALRHAILWEALQR